MKKLLLLLLPALLFSCASLPDPSESSKGLLVIPLGLENRENLELFGKYRLTFTSLSDNSQFTRIMTPANTFSQIYFEPGRYKLSLVEFIYNGGGFDSKTNKTLSSKFTIEQGQINIFSQKFITKNFTEDGTHYMSRSIENTNSKDKDNIKEYLSNLDNFHLWVME